MNCCSNCIGNIISLACQNRSCECHTLSQSKKEEKIIHHPDCIAHKENAFGCLTRASLIEKIEGMKWRDDCNDTRTYNRALDDVLSLLKTT